MNDEIKYSDNDLVTLLLCTNIGMRNNNSVPLTDTVYSSLARSLFNQGKQPKDLFRMSSRDILCLIKDNSELFKKLKIENLEMRIPELLKRHQQLFLELGTLEREGIKIVTRANREIYPEVLIKKFNAAKIVLPPVIYYAGDLNLIGKHKTLAVVGSRDLTADITAEKFTNEIVSKAIDADYSISSGGAKGIDITSEKATIDNSGRAIICVADSLIKRIKRPEIRHMIMDGDGVYMSLSHPKSTFKAFNAMNRNKIIYAVSDYAIVISCDYKTKIVRGKEVIDNSKGGTWVGCHECVDKALSTLLCRSNGNFTPRGNQEIINTLDCIEIKEKELFEKSEFDSLLQTSKHNKAIKEPVQTSLF